MTDAWYSIGIMSVPERMDMVDDLRRQLDSEDFPVAVDVYMDNDHSLGAAGNLVRVYQEMHGLPYRMMMQEDTLVCKDFKRTVQSTLEVLRRATGEFIIGYYSNDKAIGAAGKRTAYKRVKYVWGACQMIGASYMPKLLAFYDQIKLPDNSLIPNKSYNVDGTLNDCDTWVSKCCQMCGVEILASTPALVQHIGGLRSTIGHTFDPKTGKNYCKYFIGENVSGLTIDWSRYIP